VGFCDIPGCAKNLLLEFFAKLWDLFLIARIPGEKIKQARSCTSGSAPSCCDLQRA